MKFLIQLIAIIVTAYILELFLPWYSVALAAFLSGYVLKSNVNFLAGFLGIGLVWLFKAWLLHSNGATNLASKVASIFSLDHTYLLFLITVLIGGLVGGFAAQSGALLKAGKRKY